MKTSDTPSAITEEYLETIYNMAMEGEVVIGARLAQKFRVAPPTVTEMLKRLVRDGYIEMDTKRQVRLTETGNTVAETVLRRHRLTERFLVDVVKMQWHQVHEEAERLEHNMSETLEAGMLARLHNPTTCPHGNPIPGLVPNARSYLQDQGAVRLSTVVAGERVVILCISEVVEDEEALILYMHEKGLTPETHLLVLSALPEQVVVDGEDFRLHVAEREVLISKAAAAKIWVVREHN